MSDPAPDDDSPPPSDAFQALGNEVRMGVVRTLAADGPCSFSALYADSGVDTSAGFAYHLRQLDGKFVRKRADDRYELTYAGREVGRAIRAGTYTDSVDRDDLALEEPCPFCAEPELVAHVSDNVSKIACEACASPVLSLSFPPSGYATRAADSIPAALDAYHRRRLLAFADGVCPECGGTTRADVEPATGLQPDLEPDEHDPVQLIAGCDSCGVELRCPVALAVLDHPAVVSFYHDHGEDIRERPLWNVGSEWRERVVSRDPWCILVSSRLEDESLTLYVGGDGTVVESRRRSVDEQVSEPETADAQADSSDDRTEDGAAV